MTLEYDHERLLRERPWLKEYDPEVPYIARIPTFPAADVLRNTASSWPDKDAMVLRLDLYLLGAFPTVNRFANAILSLGIKQGDRIGLLPPNRPQFVISLVHINNGWNSR